MIRFQQKPDTAPEPSASPSANSETLQKLKHFGHLGGMHERTDEGDWYNQHSELEQAAAARAIQSHARSRTARRLVREGKAARTIQAYMRGHHERRVIVPELSKAEQRLNEQKDAARDRFYGTLEAGDASKMSAPPPRAPLPPAVLPPGTVLPGMAASVAAPLAASETAPTRAPRLLPAMSNPGATPARIAPSLPPRLPAP